MADELKVVVSADASRLNTEMAKATNSLQKFKAGSAQAQQSLMNLGRVVQDAPFGFIGIANNINPLLESFQRLKAETGTTGSALKALAGSLVGPAGLAFAVSAASSLLIVFGDKLFSASKKTTDAEEALKKYKDTVDAVYEGTAKEATQVSSLIAVLNSEVDTRKRKLAALEELKKINPDIFNGLKLEGDAVRGLDAAYQSYIANLKNVVAAKLIQAQLDAKLTELVKLQGSAQTKSQKDLEASLKSFNQSQVNNLKKLGDQGAKAAESLRSLQTFQDKVKSDKVASLNLEVTDLVKQLSEFSKAIKVDINTDKAKKKLKELKDIQYEVFRVRPLPSISDNELINFQQQVEKDINSLPDKITVPANIQLVGSKQFNDDINAKVFKPLQNFNAELLAAVQGTINVLVDGISQAFSGDVAGGINSIFKGLLNVVGDFLIQLGLAAIGIGKLYAAIKGGQFNPQLTIAAGIAALVLGSVIKAFIPKFATGTRFAPGGTALVGERGPELVSLPEGARVTPAAQTGAILGGAMQSIQVYGVMRGRDIYFTNQRYGNSFNVGT